MNNNNNKSQQKINIQIKIKRYTTQLKEKGKKKDPIAVYLSLFTVRTIYI